MHMCECILVTPTLSFNKQIERNDFNLISVIFLCVVFLPLQTVKCSIPVFINKNDINVTFERMLSNNNNNLVLCVFICITYYYHVNVSVCLFVCLFACVIL